MAKFRSSNKTMRHDISKFGMPNEAHSGIGLPALHRNGTGPARSPALGGRQVIGTWVFPPKTHYSIIPTFHCSITPLVLHVF
jgi:hypothetical protein